MYKLLEGHHNISFNSHYFSVVFLICALKSEDIVHCSQLQSRHMDKFHRLLCQYLVFQFLLTIINCFISDTVTVSPKLHRAPYTYTAPVSSTTQNLSTYKRLKLTGNQNRCVDFSRLPCAVNTLTPSARGFT